MSKIEIKALKYEDIDGIIKVENLCFTVPWHRQSFVEELGNPLAMYFVALFHEEVVGYAGMWLVAGEAHITNIAVHPNYQRQGIASRLLEKLIIESNHSSMTLEVRVSNKKAIDLYSKFEFEEYGIRKKYYSDNNEDALIMWRRVGKAK